MVYCNICAYTIIYYMAYYTYIYYIRIYTYIYTNIYIYIYLSSKRVGFGIQASNAITNRGLCSIINYAGGHGPWYVMSVRMLSPLLCVVDYVLYYRRDGTTMVILCSMITVIYYSYYNILLGVYYLVMTY